MEWGYGALEERVLAISRRYLVLSWFLSLGLTAGSLYFIVPLLLRGKQRYDDLVVGYTSWLDTYKSADYLLILFCFAAFFLFFAAFSGACIWLRFRAGTAVVHEQPAEASSPLVCSVLAAAAYLGTIWLFNPAPTAPSFSIGAAVLVWIVLNQLVAGYAARNRKLDRAEVFGIAFTAPLLALFSTVGVFSFAYTMSGGIVMLTSEDAAVTSIAVGLLTWCTILCKIAWSKDEHMRQLRALCARAELFTPLLLCGYVATIYHGAGGSYVREPNQMGRVVIWGAIVGMLLWNARRAFRLQSIRGIASLATVIAIVLLRHQQIPGFSILGMDDFHLGENLIPWQQIMEFGQRQYAEFVSVQGLIGLYFGGINAIFFEGTSSSFQAANLLGVAILHAAIVTLLVKRIGPLWALAVGLIAMPLSDRSLLVPIELLLLLNRNLLAAPLRWLAIYFGCTMLHVLWNASAGTALAVGLAPFAVKALSTVVFRVGVGDSLKRDPLALLMFAVCACFVLYEFPLYLGVLQFLKENGSTNTIAYGMSLFVDDHLMPTVHQWFDTPLYNRLVWELFRIGGWVIGAFGLVLAAVLLRKEKINDRNNDVFAAPVFVLTLCGGVFVLVMLPYTMGRVDPQALSRSGFLSMFMLGFFVPLAILYAAERRGYFTRTGAMVLGLAFGVCLTFNPLEYNLLGHKAFSKMDVPFYTVPLSVTADLLPRLGTGYVPVPRLEEIKQFKLAVDKLLEPGESYLDLTNRSAFYFFTGREVPVPYSADYLAANELIQSREVARLEQTRPPLVWLAPGVHFDGPPTSLRSYRIYRWLLLNGYRYFENGPFAFLASPERYSRIAADLKNKVDENAGWRRIFHLSDLKGLPGAWGRNFEHLKERFAAATDLSGIEPELQNFKKGADGWFTIVERKPVFTWNLTTPLKGRENEFLLLRLERKADEVKEAVDDYSLRIAWSEKGSEIVESNFFNLRLREDTVLIPMASHPDWLRADAIDRIQITLRHDRRGAAWKLREFRGLKLVR